MFAPIGIMMLLMLGFNNIKIGREQYRQGDPRRALCSWLKAMVQITLPLATVVALVMIIAISILALI